jgi:DNA-binding CsgD family transcriptional regulator
MLLGREREREAIGRALERAQAGESTTLVLLGEAGIGKTALLEYAAERAAGMRVLRARGIESEAQIPFASLLELLRPALTMVDRIPAPQAMALEAALALRPGRAQERFAVGAATLSVLAAYGEDGPVVLLVDDAHWLDGPSAEALLFAIRRLVADPIAVLIATREGDPSLLIGADLPTRRLGGLSSDEAVPLLAGLTPRAAERLHRATAGNPLALIELASDAHDLELAPDGAPVLVSARIARAFLRRVDGLDPLARRVLVLLATSDSGDLPMLERAAARLGIELSTLAAAETAGLVTVGVGSVEFRHPLARSAIYADASAEDRRAAHRALAEALPDRDVDRRAWHLAAAAIGTDEAASAALEQAGARSRARSAYATASAAFERAARLTAARPRRARLLLDAADSGWHAGAAERAGRLLEAARGDDEEGALGVAIDRLTGHIAVRRGPVMRGHDILVAAAARAEPEAAVAMLAEAVIACFQAGDAGGMLRAGEAAQAALSDRPSGRARLLAATAFGMGHVIGGDGAAGAEAVHRGVALAESSPELRDDPELLPWLAIAPLFLREAGAGRLLLDQALEIARERAALGALPFVLSLLARDQATTDRWAVAESTYQEAIGLARETDQRTDLAFALTGLAWVQARRGREAAVRSAVAEALELSAAGGSRLYEVWGTAALGELELGRGDAINAAAHFEHQRRLLHELGITDVDLFPGAELVDVYLRLGRDGDAELVATEFMAAARAKGQPWSMARAQRCWALLADDADLVSRFEQALQRHAETADVFETARTRLAFGERLRRARNRVLARDQLRRALETFEHLDAAPWAERAGTELAATGERLRRRDPSTLDELTPQEHQIATLLAQGRTTREAAAALFLSPKTVEYHLRHVYLKLGIHSREELARALADSSPVPGPAHVEADRTI